MIDTLQASKSQGKIVDQVIKNNIIQKNCLMLQAIQLRTLTKKYS